MGMMIEDEIVFKKLNEIKPYVRNPRHNQKTVELLCKLIPKVGFNVPIVIDQKGVIVKGHARYAAAIRLGMKEVPCIVSHADEEQIKIDRITDNKIAEFSEWMNDEVAAEIDSLDFDFDFSELGFPSVKFEGMPEPEIPARGAEKPQDGSEGDNVGVPMGEGVKGAVKRYFKVVCDGCGHVMFVEASKVQEA